MLKTQGEPVIHDALVYLASPDSNGVRHGLHRMERALDDRGRPEQRLRTLPVAGTGMLTSCAAGVTVCNIDYGFGAAFAALRILQSSPRYRPEPLV